MTKPQAVRFSSHTFVLNFTGTVFHVTPRMWANPSWTNVPRHTTNFRSDFFHLTHPCFELCRNSSPCYTTHVSQPILYQRPKIHHKRLMTQFCFVIPSTSNLPRYTSQNFNVHRIGGKNVEPCKKTHTVEWKPVCDLQASSGQKWFSAGFSGLNYLRPTYCKHALKRCSLGWNPLASWFI